MQIKSFDQLINVLTLQKQNLSTYETEVGATAQDLIDVPNELDNLSKVAEYCSIVDAGKQTSFAIKQAMFNGDPDEPVVAFPGFPAPPTLTDPVSGILTRTNDRNKRYKAAPGYTQEIGEALGIVGPAVDAPSPDSVEPSIDVFGAQAAMLFSVVVTNRGESNMWEVQAKPVIDGTWQTVGSATGKAADFTWPGGGATPIQLQVRVQLKKNNQNYGQLSAIKQVTVNP